MNHYYHQLSVKEPVAEPLTLMQKQTGCDDIFCNQLSLLLTAYSRLLCHAPLWLPYSKTIGKIDTLSYFRFNASSKLKWIYKVWKNRWLITRMADSVTPVTFYFYFFKGNLHSSWELPQVRHTFEGNIPNAVSWRGPGSWLHMISLSALGRKQWKAPLTHSVYILPPPSPPVPPSSYTTNSTLPKPLAEGPPCKYIQTTLHRLCSTSHRMVAFYAKKKKKIEMEASLKFWKGVFKRREPVEVNEQQPDSTVTLG